MLPGYCAKKGESDIEKDWDAYLSQLEALGLAEYTRLAQTAYDGL